MPLVERTLLQRHLQLLNLIQVVLALQETWMTASLTLLKVVMATSQTRTREEEEEEEVAEVVRFHLETHQIPILEATKKTGWLFWHICTTYILNFLVRALAVLLV
nr:PREDICTED: uncharacterized protein LOC106704211 isoform X2 [Latimeria chalumnae]|eukprot:XP_014346187.1 PREDICTED: uncharacterized protein LOC106704211 isoform X2 [Latimeria chalumnae]